MGVKYIALISNSAEYKKIHKLLYQTFGLAKQHNCSYNCGKKAKDWSWIKGLDPLDVNSYWPLCRSCHKQDDYTDQQRKRLSAIMIGNQIAKGPHVFKRN